MLSRVSIRLDIMFLRFLEQNIIISVSSEVKRRKLHKGLYVIKTCLWLFWFVRSGFVDAAGHYLSISVFSNNVASLNYGITAKINLYQMDKIQN